MKLSIYKLLREYIYLLGGENVLNITCTSKNYYEKYLLNTVDFKCFVFNRKIENILKNIKAWVVLFFNKYFVNK